MAGSDVTDPFAPGRDDTKQAVQQARRPDTARIAAGKSLLLSLEQLGIVPDVLAWVGIRERVELALVTSLSDRIGPLKLYDLFFAAQDRGVIGIEVPLMDVSIYSPDTEIGIDLRRQLASVQESGHVQFDPARAPSQVDRAVFVLGAMDPVVVLGAEVLAVRATGFSATQDLRRWKRAETVLARAA